MTLLRCATTNPGKLKEFFLIAEHYAPGLFRVESTPNLGNIAAPEETGETFEENAVLKAVYYSQFTPDLVFTDDSGLAVDALGGAPGVHSARYAGPNATDAENNEKLLAALDGAANRAARYVCVIALAHRGKLLATHRGEVEGVIIDPKTHTTPAGPHGFGYDPFFFYPPFNATFADTLPERKLLVSHRAKAFLPLLAYKPE